MDTWAQGLQTRSPGGVNQTCGLANRCSASAPRREEHACRKHHGKAKTDPRGDVEQLESPYSIDGSETVTTALENSVAASA